MTIEELKNCIVEYCNADDKRVALCIMAEPDGNGLKVSCNMRGTGLMICYILSELMQDDHDLYLLLRTAVKMRDSYEQEKKSDS